MKSLIASSTALFIALGTAPAFANNIAGTWAGTDGLSHIKISKCGSKFCAKIIWMKNPLKDERNQNKSLRSRNLVGTQISNNLKAAGANKWSGSVYSPRKGKTYSGFATVSGKKMTMKGCLTSAGLLCQKRNFTRIGG